MTARLNTKSSLIPVTALWIAAPWAPKPELIPVSREQQLNMTTANLVLTNVPWIHVHPLTPARKRNVPTNIAKTAVSRAMSGTQAPKPAPVTRTNINILVPVPTKPEVPAHPVTENISHAVANQDMSGKTDNASAERLLNIPARELTKAQAVPAAAGNISLVPAMIHMNGNTETVFVPVNIPVPVRMKSPSEFLARRNMTHVLVKNLMNGEGANVFVPAVINTNVQAAE